MGLTRDDILNLAKLSRLRFNENEIEGFQSDLNNIMDYIDVLNEVDTKGVEPLVHINNNDIDLREDKIEKSLTSKEAMVNAPQSEDGALVVPKMIGE